MIISLPRLICSSNFVKLIKGQNEITHKYVFYLLGKKM